MSKETKGKVEKKVKAAESRIQKGGKADKIAFAAPLLKAGQSRKEVVAALQKKWADMAPAYASAIVQHARAALGLIGVKKPKAVKPVKAAKVAKPAKVEKATAPAGKKEAAAAPAKAEKAKGGKDPFENW